MKNKELTEKILKKIYDYEKENMHKSYTNVSFEDWKGQIGSTREIEKAISLTIAEKDAQKDLFIKKLKKQLTTGNEYMNKLLRKRIDELNKEVFGDEN